jgi:putative ABC transport system permease protein
MSPLLPDVRLAARSLARNPGFAAAAALTLALGVGAVTTVFAFADAIVLSPLPYAQANRLVTVGHVAPGLALDGVGISDGTYLHYRDRGRAFAALAMYHESAVNLSTEPEARGNVGGQGSASDDGPGDRGEAAERVAVAVVTHNFFTVFGVRPALGRLPTAADADRGSGEAVAVLSHDLWVRRYGSDPGIVGRTIFPNRAPRRVLGVLEEGFAFPSREVGIWFPADPPATGARAADLYNQGVALLAPGFDAAAAARDLDRLIPSLPDVYPDLTRQVLADAQLRAAVTPLHQAVVGDTAAALWLLLGGMGFLLAIACANVANLFLLRGEHREREMAVRAALGAGRGDLLRAFAAEGLVLALLGGVGGLLLARAAVALLVAAEVTDLPRLAEVAVDARVALFALALSLAVAFLLALLPLLRSSRRPAGAALAAGGRAAGPGRERQRIRRVLVTAQVALALTLLVGAALLARSSWRILHADPGFAAAGVLTAELALPRRAYPDHAATRRFWDELVERVEALPGVESAGMATSLPLVPQDAFHDYAIDVEDRPGESRGAMSVYHASLGWFATMRMPLVAGRGITASAEGERSILLSAAAAQRLFPGRSPLGKRLRRSAGGPDQPWMTVVGVVGDVPRERVGGEAAEVLYLPLVAEPADLGQWPSYGTLAVRANVPPAALGPAIRQVVRDLDPHLPLAAMRTMEEVVAASAARPRFVMLLLGVAAVAALALGAVGLYGVVAYTVERRTREVGIRLALGAHASAVRNDVLRETAALAIGGIAAGSLTALASTRFLRGLLYEVSPTDPVVLLTVAALVLAVALCAGWLPARRAVRIDPMTALRRE